MKTPLDRIGKQNRRSFFVRAARECAAPSRYAVTTSMQAPAEFLDDLPQVVDVLFDDSAGLL
jgi:hypothetical protein